MHRSAVISNDFEALSLVLEGFDLPQGVREAVITLVAHNARIAPPLPKKVERAPTLGELAETFRQTSMRRSQFIGPDLINEAAWHMMLAMFTAMEDGQPTSVSNLCHASGGAPTTALRYLKALEDNGLTSRRDDPADGRRQIIALNPKAHNTVREMILSFCDVAKTS